MPNYELVYFNARGRGELTRLIFTAGGGQFTDTRIEFANWEAKKSETPLGVLPYMIVDGSVKLTQSIAIARYAAREMNLAGTDHIKQAQADAIVDTLGEILASFIPVFKTKEPETKKALLEKWMASELTTKLSELEKLVCLYGSNGFAVGDSLTWADLYIYHMAFTFFSMLPEYKSMFPLVAAVDANVAKNEKIADYVSKRPVTDF